MTKKRCSACGITKRIYAKGLCPSCYHKAYQKTDDSMLCPKCSSRLALDPFVYCKKCDLWVLSNDREVRCNV